ncbi:PEGA domain-containing protein [Proteiniphilum sp.]|uniref:PEGA domain-containing protein n=1 Tax=Proteiniphilum sp. TaxID=1926877 RepID=UPI002B203593|nr:PEGA domain-containing protein [Proteiniphilum sp.]MEA4916417.1 PEGA domain-containing protein [Proteiniphilum sp.]
MLQKSLLIRTASILLAISVLFAGCASTTLIQSEPTGAKVYMNGEYKGVTPLSYSDTKIVGSVTYVTLEKEGYEPFQTYLSRNESADIGAIIGGFFLMVPFLWTMKYNPVHTYELRPIRNASVAKADQPVVLTDSNGNEYISCVLKD